MNVLLCDDEPALLQTIGEYLETRGVAVDYASRAERAVRLANEQAFDVIVLDIKMPGMSGLEACKALRASGILIPILFLTARDSLDDTLAGFSAGGDDYLVKPFAFEELHARLLALSHRFSRQGSSVISIADLSINLQTNEVSRRGEKLRLNPTQFRILKCLATRSPAVVTRSEIERSVWGDEIPDSDTLRTHVFQLRSVVDKPFSADLIRTVHGIGFRLCADPSTDVFVEAHRKN